MSADVERTIVRAKRKVLRQGKNCHALVLIGSVADGTNAKRSDVDIVWVTKKKVDFQEHVKIEEAVNTVPENAPVQLVPLTVDQLRWHFSHASTMAHSIRRGRLLYGRRSRVISDLLEQELGLPSSEWMGCWLRHFLKRHAWSLESIRMEGRHHGEFCGRKCSCQFHDDLARVVVNYAILYLELRGIVPTSRFQIRKALKAAFGADMMKSVNLALDVAGRDDFLTRKQIESLADAAMWFKRRLVRTKLMKVVPAEHP